MASKCRFNFFFVFFFFTFEQRNLKSYIFTNLCEFLPFFIFIFCLHCYFSCTQLNFDFLCRSKWVTLWKTVQKLVWCFSTRTAELLLILCEGSKLFKTGTGMFAFSMFWRHFKQALRYGHISRPCKAMALRTALEKYVKSTGMNKY